MSLEDAVQAYRSHLAELPDKIKPNDLLKKRPLPLYWSLGIATPELLARALIADRLAASMEMAMGYLYQFVVQDAGKARKLTNAEKKKWRGVDFRKESGPDVVLLNLKSARATSNSDITQETLRNLAKAAQVELTDQKARGLRGDDNPLLKAAGSLTGSIRVVRAIARGPASSVDKEHDGASIEILIGDELWLALGLGPGFGRKIQLSVGASPVDAEALEAAIERAVERVVKTIERSECVRADGTLDWPCLLDKFPDA